jgi:anti-sigma B factor antagonist
LQPAQQSFSVSVRQPSPAPQVAILDLEGEVDKSAEAALHDAYDQAECDQATILLLNFTRVAAIYSTGIAIIVGLLARSRRRQHRLFAFGLDAHYEEIFHITRLADFIPVYPDEDTALQAVVS